MTSAIPGKQSITRTTLLEAAGTLRLLGTTASSSAQLVRMLCDDTVGTDELSLRIEGDPVLCARVLRVANSAYYAQQRTVTSIRRAFLVVGLKAVRGIAAAACIDQIIPQRLASLDEIPALLRHSLATGLASEMLAAWHCPELTADAFIAGLLHNLGIVLQATVDPGGVAAMVAATGSKGPMDIRALERHHTAIGHEEALSVVFDAWQLPDSLIAVAAHHHRPAGAPETHRPLVTLVGFGARLAAAFDRGFSLEPSTLDLESDLEMSGLRELTPRQLDAFREELPRRVTHLTNALG